MGRWRCTRTKTSSTINSRRTETVLKQQELLRRRRPSVRRSRGEERRIQSAENHWMVRRDDRLWDRSSDSLGRATDEAGWEGGWASEGKVRISFSIEPLRRSRSRQFGGRGELRESDERGRKHKWKLLVVQKSCGEDQIERMLRQMELKDMVIRDVLDQYRPWNSYHTNCGSDRYNSYILYTIYRVNLKCLHAPAEWSQQKPRQNLFCRYF